MEHSLPIFSIVIYDSIILLGQPYVPADAKPEEYDGRDGFATYTPLTAIINLRHSVDLQWNLSLFFRTYIYIECLSEQLAFFSRLLSFLETFLLCYEMIAVPRGRRKVP